MNAACGFLLVRALFVAATMSAIPLAAVAQPTRAQIDAYPHDQAREVYRAVLDVLFNGAERPGTVVIHGSLGTYFGPHDDIRESRTGFDSLALSNLIAVTSVPFGREIGPQFAMGAFPRIRRYPIPIVLLSEAQLESLRSARPGMSASNRPGVAASSPSENPFWNAFRTKYPRAWGMTAFTRVGFNPGRTEALVQVRHGCGECASAETILLRRQKGSSVWRIEARIPHWNESREAVAPGELRYVGRGASKRAAHDSAENVRLREFRDSLRREQAPRAIRGRVVNALTGKGMAGHPLYQLLGRDDNPDRVAVTGRDGRFTIANPPIGGWFLTVQCDGRFGHYRSLADAGFYVGPGLDTTMVFEARTIAPCWKRRFHQLQSGEVESGIHQASTFPDTTEAAVYGVAIAALFPDPAHRPLLRSHTVARCSSKDLYCDGTSHLALLLREHAADTSTVEEYERAWRQHVPLNADFASRNSTALLTHSIARYLIEEAIAATPEKNSHTEEESLWYALAKAYPNHRGILSFTRAGFNTARTEALVTIRHEASLLSATHQTMLLRRVGTVWRVIRENLEGERIGAGMDDGRCLIARGASALRITQPVGLYEFSFVGTDGRIERETLDAGNARSWGSGGWDLSLGRRLLRPGTQDSGRFSGTWIDIGRDVIPIDAAGNRIPERNGHFCAVAVIPE